MQVGDLCRLPDGRFGEIERIDAALGLVLVRLHDGDVYMGPARNVQVIQRG